MREVLWRDACKAVACLEPSLKHDNADNANPLSGYCYVVAEALYHYCPKVWRQAFLKPCYVKVGQETHWYLQFGANEIIDPTAGQYKDVPEYWTRGRGCGFLTKKPSRRGKRLLQRMRALDRGAKRPRLHIDKLTEV